MLSYRHSYHAGNFADVLKHTVLVSVLEYLKKKDKPFIYLDTHAGAGMYSLKSEQAQQTEEYKHGIGVLWQQDQLPTQLERYLKVVRAVNLDGKLTRYPGSPSIARHLLSEQDQLFLYELHNTEIGILRTALKKDARVSLYHEDGFKHSLGLLPPKQRRGVILIDPAYEIKQDYAQVLTTLLAFYKRFATGTYLLWYPVVERERINQLEKKIQSSALRNVSLFELGQTTDTPTRGMTASGVIVVNPPWTLQTEMATVLPFLADKLGLAGKGHYRLQQLCPENLPSALL